MKIDKTQINGNQFMFTIACFIYGSGLLGSFLPPIAVNESWIISLASGVLVFPLFLIFKALMVKFPKKNLFQIFEHVYGEAFGKFLSFLFLLFFLTLTGLNMADLSNFTNITMLRKTPDFFILAITLIIAAYAVFHGIKVVTRYSFILAVVSFFILILSIVLLIGEFDLLNFLPIFNLEPIRYVQGISTALTIPLGEFVVLLMITPNIKVKDGKIGKYIFGGTLMGVISLALVKLRDIGVLGEIYNLLTLPPLASLRLVNFGDAFARVEVFFAIILIFLLFFKVTLMFYISLISICQIFEVKDYKRLIWPLALFFVLFGLSFAQMNPAVNIAVAKDTTSIPWGIFEYVIPLITLIVAVATGKTKSKERIFDSKQSEKRLKRYKPKKAQKGASA